MLFKRIYMDKNANKKRNIKLRSSKYYLNKQKTMRKLLFLILTLIPMTMSAYDALINGIYYNRVSETEVEVTYKYNKYNSYSGDIVIPERVFYKEKEFVVIGIGEYAFYNCDGLGTITLPETLTYIDTNAFGNSNITSIEIPQDVTTINDNAFFGCSNLTAITLPENIATIGDKAFSNCTDLSYIYCCSTTPPTIEKNTFDQEQYAWADLNVPQGCIDTYATAKYWEEFKVKKEFDADGVTSVANERLTIKEIFDLNGRKLSQTKQGVNIVRYANGTTKKVIVK